MLGYGPKDHERIFSLAPYGREAAGRPGGRALQVFMLGYEPKDRERIFSLAPYGSEAVGRLGVVQSRPSQKTRRMGHPARSVPWGYLFWFGVTLIECNSK